MGEYEYDYDRVVDDSDDLLEDEDYSDDSYDYDYVNEREFDCYYHTLADELADE
jgi:hypothetical protein